MPIDTGHDLAERNQLTREEVKRFREAWKNGRVNAEHYHDLKHRHPFMGFVKCGVNDIHFLMFSANDDVVAWEYFWLGNDSYETKTVKKWLELAKGARTIVDIGAYTGVMSVIAALVNPKAKIYAFEAMERTLERLKINIAINNLKKNIETFGVAASDKEETKTINLYRDEDFLGTGNSFQEKAGIKIVAKKQIHAVPIDSLINETNVDLVKIDVEGHEVAVLNGMRKIIESNRPKMIVEVWKHNWDDITKFVEVVNYKYEQIEGMNYLFEPM